MQDYVTCSFKGTESLGSLSILLASDEKSPEYRAEIRKMLENVGLHHFVDMDAALESQDGGDILPAKYQNNVFTSTELRLSLGSTWPLLWRSDLTSDAIRVRQCIRCSREPECIRSSRDRFHHLSLSRDKC